MAGVLTERNNKLRQRLIDTVPVICTERAQIWTKVFIENEDKVPILKAAIALKETLGRMSLLLGEDELIVGNQGNGLRATTINPIVNTWFTEELDKFNKRDGSLFYISEENKKILKELAPCWKGRTVYDKTIALMPERTKEAMDALVFSCGYTLTKGCGHWLLNMEQVLKYGFSYIQKNAEEQLANCDFSDSDGIDKIPFYQAVIMTCSAVKDFAARYADLAAEQAKAKTGKRHTELLEIERICRKVPYYAPDTYHEALQTVYFVQLLTQIESDGTGISPGRLDFLLYPFYERDRSLGRLTKEQAEELTDQLWLKIASIIQIWNEKDTKSFGGHPISQAITLGGVDEEGKDSVNELSYLMLETTSRIHMAQPSVCCRISTVTPFRFIKACVEVIREGLGMPALYNDELAIQSLTDRSIDLKDARRNFAVIGCVEMGVQGKLCAFANSGYFNLAKTLEIALHNGKDPVTGKILAAPRGPAESMKNYEELESAFYGYLEELLQHQVRVTNAVDTIHARIAPLPFVSAITDDCIERGLEVQSGGAVYNYDGIQGVGFADVVDSLAAIKKLVFEEKKFTMLQLMEALEHNFKGYEQILISLKKDVSKFGNNQEEANVEAKKLAEKFAQFVSGYHNTRGGFFVPGMYSNSANVPLGAVVGALPNGRRAFTPIAEACSPSHGAEKNGPTQAALSVTALEHRLFTNGTQYNQKYHPSALKDEKGVRSLANLVQTYFQNGGYHIQFNVVSSETLRAAQKDPDQYRDLVVRVAGYTAFFTDLNKSIQEDIIDRTELDFGL